MAVRGRQRINSGGWSPLPEAPAGDPEADYVRLAPLLEEFREIQAYIDRTLAVNPDNVEVKGMIFVARRLRRRIWEALNEIDEATPQVLGPMLAVSEQTIRNWCNDPSVPVRHRRKGSRYLVDVQSARDYAACSRGAA